ncbi:MAG: hypothetical protein FJ044_04660 [Candidatus Cloacimonetes bacterium]|nr:hypothetical protein [Candidatus Cloacimonadota bacterium]
MKHQPTLLDAAVDLQRCIYASFSEQGTNDPNFKIFLQHAKEIINQSKGSIDNKAFEVIESCLNKVEQPNTNLPKLREDLLMAASLLHNRPSN